ncbi:MAG: ABC transporter ATP-binding protein [Chlamydiota bacterium]
MKFSLLIKAVDLVIDGRSILSQVTLDLPEPRIGIIGLNGSGKTTLMRLINGLELPTTGRVVVDGFDTQKATASVRQRVGFVFQNPDHQILYPTVEEDLAFGLKQRGFSKQVVRSQVEALLKQYQLEALRHRLTHQLSAGEKQMVALLGVAITAPTHILLDEPTALLDWQQKERLVAALAAMDQQVIIATHQLELLQDFDRVIGLHAGKVFIDDKPKLAMEKYGAAFRDTLACGG